MLHLRVSDACFSGTEHGERLQRMKEAGVLALKKVGRWSVQRSEGALGVQDAQGSRWGGWAVPTSDENGWRAGRARRTGVGREALGI